MTWRDDLPTERQLQYLRHLGCSVIPSTKGEASEMIAARVPKPTTPDSAEIVDKAAERVKRELAEAEQFRVEGEPALALYVGDE